MQKTGGIYAPPVFCVQILETGGRQMSIAGALMELFGPEMATHTYPFGAGQLEGQQRPAPFFVRKKIEKYKKQ